MATLDILNVSKRFGKEASAVYAVNNVNLGVGSGEFVCILGPSGCGKSTLLRMIAGFETLTSGDVQIDKVSVSDTPANRRPTAMVFQKYTLWPHMGVYDNIAFGLRQRHWSRPEIDRRVRQALKLVGLGTYGERMPSQLSGGEQQRVAIARAVAKRPDVLLCDEPTGALDAETGRLVLKTLLDVNREIGTATAVITHNAVIAGIADRVLRMTSGHIVSAEPNATRVPVDSLVW